ncbi:MAG: hypothetical protein Q4D52_01420 [Eubacteriales bacterium]|nr:hypothetical protein [Eubacteriales bacterium]
MKKKILIGIIVLVVIGIFYLEYSALTYGKYRLSPGATTTIKIEKNIGLESRTELIIRKNGGDVLELLGYSRWADNDNEAYFYVDKQTITILGKRAGDKTVIKGQSKSVNGIRLSNEGIIIDFKGERKFYVSRSKETTVTIRNLSDHSVYFEADVIYR